MLSNLSRKSRIILVLMATREPLVWQQPATGCPCAFFPGAEGQWPLVGAAPLRFVKALHRAGAIERFSTEGPDIWHARPSSAGLATLAPTEISVAREWNDQRNAEHIRKT